MSVQMRCHFIDDAPGHFVQRWVGCRTRFPTRGTEVPDPEDAPLFPRYSIYPGRGKKDSSDLGQA